MNFLDIRTVIFSQMLTDIVCTAVLAFLWLQNRKRFAGLSDWLLDFAFQSAAAVLITLRGTIPEWISIFFSTPLVVAGAFLGYRGLVRFTGMRGRQVHNYVLMAAFAAVHLYYIAVLPDLHFRTANFSLALLIICFQCTRLMLRRVASGMRVITRGTGIVFGIFSLASAARIAIVLIDPDRSNDFFQSDFYNTLVVLSYQLLLILLTFSLVLMTNKRLLMEIQDQEEKYSKAFRSSPYAITLTRLADGRILEVNDGFEAITGYPRSEVIGKTSLEMHLWDQEDDRTEIFHALSRGERVSEREFRFRKKSGDLLTGLFSSEIIMLNGQAWALASISDITGRKLAEEQIKALLREKELLLKEVHHRIKNNMSTVIALISMQIHTMKEPSAINALDEASGRVRSMMVLYDRLYRSGNYRELPVKEYIKGLLEEIGEVFLKSKPVKIEKQIDDFILPVKKLQPLGIIINELVTNAMKYAFTGRESGVIRVSVVKKEDRAVFTVEDDGVGMPGPGDPGKSKGFGLELVGILMKQLKGTMRIEGEKGTRVIFDFII